MWNVEHDVIHTDSFYIYLRYTIHSIYTSSNSEGSKKLPDDGRLLPKYVEANTYNKGAVQSVYTVGFL
jgi:hypothetical protein